ALFSWLGNRRVPWIVLEEVEAGALREGHSVRANL
ncbi:MAG: hypothetical protein ACJAVJ_000057, partial [Planctomycetota bacterium]